MGWHEGTRRSLTIDNKVTTAPHPNRPSLNQMLQNTCYEIIVLRGRSAYLSGHSLYSPQPVLVTIAGSTWGGSTLKVHFIGRGICGNKTSTLWLPPVSGK